MNKNEDINLCRECGGRCCKKGGCDYSAADFKDLSFNGICQILSEGRVSIVAVLIQEFLPNGKRYLNPLLMLRARNTNRDVIDLVSMKTRCAQLGENGCLYTNYEDRPAGARNLVPQPGYEDGDCYPEVDPIEIGNTWMPYQKVLSRIVKRYTVKSVDDKIKEDIEKLFEDIFQQNFEYVSEQEKKELLAPAVNIAYTYPEIYKRVESKYSDVEPIILIKK